MLEDIVRSCKILKDNFTYNRGMTQIAVGSQIWNYGEVGGGEQTPILILHGWGRSGTEWLAMARDLSAWSDRKVFVVDLPGFGGSSLPKVKTIFDYSQLVKDFCAYLEIERVILIGHSLGGRVGIVLGSTSPALVERLILIDPAGVKAKSIKRVTMQLLAKLFSWAPSDIRSKIIGQFMDEDYHNSPALRELYRAVVSADLRRYLPQIQAETLVVWGEHDPILPLSLSRVYIRSLAGARLRVVWGAGHDPHLSHYEQTLHILQEGVE
jgi:pimeloyl-ACP methyl ester carboxylesterase